MLAIVAEWAGDRRMADVDESLELRVALSVHRLAIKAHVKELILSSQTGLPARSGWRAIRRRQNARGAH
jgi:hypothetical protein